MLPLHRLFSALQAAGLFIGPAERLRVQQVLADNPAAWQTAEGRAALMYELAPLLCRNRTEQEVFYKTYQAFLAELAEPIEIKEDEEEQKPAFWKKYGKILFGILALVAALFAAWWWMKHRTVEENVTIDFRIKPGQVFGGKLAPGDTLFLINQSSVKDTANYDFTWLVYEWREENGPIFMDTAFETRYILPELLDHKKYERFRIQLQAMHRQTRQLHTGRAREITVVQPCPKPIQVKDSILVAGQVKTGSNIQVFAPKDAPKHCEFEWSFEDQADFSDTTIYTRNPVYKIKKAGTLTLRLHLTDTTQAGYCDTNLTKEIFIQEDIPTLAALPLFKDDVRPSWLYTWISIAIALMAYVMATWFAWRWWHRPSVTIPPPAPNISESLRRAFETEPADKTPYSIPHRSNNSQIRLAAEQIELANTFRRRQEGQVAMLNIPRSIQATMEKLGYAELRFSFNTRPTHYLFLIDLQNEVSHQAQLFRYLVEMLEGQDVLADVFFYKNSLARCWNKLHPEGLSLEQLAMQYADRRLVVFGDGYRLLTEADEGEALHKEQAEALRHWPQRMLLTPAPIAAWTYREARLYQLWAVFHADLGGLMQAARFVESGMDDENLPPTFAEWKRQCQRSAIDADTDRDWDTPAEHRDYLREADDRDGALYRWLRALSVYPELNWNVTIAIGRALGIEVRYEHLLVLARIPWLQSGAMKPALWRAWMREMPLPDAAPDETLARSAVLAELRAVEALCAEGYADQKMQTRLAVQHFALAPADRDAQDRLYYILQHIAPAPLLTEELDRTVQRHIPEFQWTDQKTGRALAYLSAGQPQPSVQRPFWTRHIIWCMLCWPFFLLPLLVVPERWAGLYERYPTVMGLFVAPQEDEAVRLNNLAVEEMYNDSTLHSYKFIQLGDIPGSQLLWSGDDSYPVFRMLSDAIFLRNGAYPLAETNRAKILFNSGLQFLDVKLLRVKDPEKDAQEQRIRGIALLQLAVQNDSLRLPAAEALAVAYYQNQQPDSACYWMNQVLALKPDARNWLAESGVKCLSNTDIIIANIQKNMIPIRGGTFRMGSDDKDEDAQDDEKNAHYVTLSNFSMGRTEVTYMQYAAFLNEKGNQEEDGVKWIDLLGEYESEKCRIVSTDDKTFSVEKGYESHPVICVSWYGSRAFCQWLSEKTGKKYRLPKEAEWEYAARGGRADKYAGTSKEGKLSEFANFCDSNCGESWAEKKQNDGYKYTAPVGRFKPNGFGLYDMSGNVGEWCEDDWHDNYEGAPENGRAWVDRGSRGEFRVTRGGSYNSNARYCRSAYRSGDGPAYRSNHVGFRLSLQ